MDGVAYEFELLFYTIVVRGVFLRRDDLLLLFLNLDLLMLPLRPHSHFCASLRGPNLLLALQTLDLVVQICIRRAAMRCPNIYALAKDRLHGAVSVISHLVEVLFLERAAVFFFGVGAIVVPGSGIGGCEERGWAAAVADAGGGEEGELLALGGWLVGHLGWRVVERGAAWVLELRVWRSREQESIRSAINKG